MSSITNIEKIKIEKLLGMNSGYVLDFSNRNFGEFILTSTQKDIWSEEYAYDSGSKANRLRAFWNKESDVLVGKLLLEMLEYWKTTKLISDIKIEGNDQMLFKECQLVASRLLGKKHQNDVKGTTYETEDEFINREFKNITLNKLGLEGTITDILNQRLDEIRKCLNSKAALAVIFLCGSTLEGILLGVATNKPKDFNQSTSAPKYNGKILPFNDWTLNNFIDVSYSLGLLQEDVKKFSHALRDFRNYIHPYQQVASKFNPSLHTAEICWKVLQAAISQLSEKSN